MLRTSKLHMITKIVHDQPYHQRFSNKIEAVQYNAALAIKNAIKETSTAKLYKELGIESLGFSQWIRRLCTFYKIKTQGVPKYVLKITHMTVALHIQLVHIFAEQMPSNTPFSLTKFENGIN